MTSNSPRVRYDPVGYCIYCGRSDVPLTLEHIVPKGIGGNLELPASSCEEHRRITSAVEQYCLRPMLGSFRIHTGLSKREVPETLPLNVITDDGAYGIKMVHPSEYPYILHLAKFPPPGILVGRDPRQNIALRPWVWSAHGERERLEPIHGGQGFQGPPFDPMQFSRMVAKIGLGYAEAMSRVHGFSFTPIIRDLILKDGIFPFHLVGTDGLDDPPPTEDNAFHHLTYMWSDGDPDYLIVVVRLFACISTPRYYVVVGYSS